MLLLTWECTNHLFGTTSNPHNIKRVPGGSSGGEGCLIAAKCSPGGVGTDIGGSIRIPAAYCGIYGIKYTNTRVSQTNSLFPNVSGRTGAMIKATYGPMCRSADDLITMSKAF